MLAMQLISIGLVLAVALADLASASEDSAQAVGSGSCSQHTSSFAYIVERIAGGGEGPQLRKRDVCGDCSESSCVVQFADSAASANQSARVASINAAWFQLQRVEASRGSPFHHYVLIVEGATLASSSSPDPPPPPSALLRSFELALSGANFLVAVPPLHSPTQSSASNANATAPVTNPFASGILAAKASAAPDLFPLASAVSLGANDTGSSDLGFALSAASVIAHRRFGLQFVTTTPFAVLWSLPPPLGIGPSSFLLSAQAGHAQLCALYNAFTDHESCSALPVSAEQIPPQPSQSPDSAPLGTSCDPLRLRAPDCCNMYWRHRNACSAFTAAESCPPQSTPLFCELNLSEYAHKWTYADSAAPQAAAKQHHTLASLPLSAFSFSSVWCHNITTGSCSCSVDQCSPTAALRYPQLESMTAWTPSSDDASPWLQMDFGEVTKTIGVITRARRDEQQWVRTFRVTASNSSNASDSSGGVWVDVGSYLGNNDPHNQKVNMFPSPVFARFIRIYPTAMYSYRSLRVDAIIDSQRQTNRAYIMPNLNFPPHNSMMQSLRGKRILMIGDSHTRFHYLHLAHWLCFQQQAGSKFVEDMFWKDGTLDWQTYDEKWDDFFRESTFAFDGQQMCDCHRPANWREFGYEIRVTRCSGVEITFVLMYGMTRALGRLPLHLGDFDSLSQSRAINSVQRCSAVNRGCPKHGCSNMQQSGQFQAQVEELKAKLTAQVLVGEIDPDDMFNILETYEKSNIEPPPRICPGSGGYAWHEASYGKSGNGGVWEFANLSHFLEAWSNATGGADVFFIGQGAHLDHNNSAHIESIASSCSIAKKNLSSSRCIWRAPRKKEVRLIGIDPVSYAIRASNSSTNSSAADWSIFRPDDLLFYTPAELHVDSVGHLSGAANDVLNNGFLWLLWSLMAPAK